VAAKKWSGNMQLIDQIIGGGWGSVALALASAIVGKYLHKVTPTAPTPDKPATPDAAEFSLWRLLGPSGDHFPVLQWFANLPEESRRGFFEAIAKKVGK
jgi:hypothetical protein